MTPRPRPWVGTGRVESIVGECVSTTETSGFAPFTELPDSVVVSELLDSLTPGGLSKIEMVTGTVSVVH